MRELLFFPCNGNALEALDSLGPDDRLLGFIDDDPGKQGAAAFGVPVYGRDALQRFSTAHVLAVPGNPKNFRERKALILSLQVPASRFATVIHPQARISPRATIGYNVYIGPGVVVTGNAVLGDHVCVLPNTVIHHDSIIGDHVLIGSNCTVAGYARIGENSYIGSGSGIRDGVTIGRDVLVGMGSNVISNIPDRSTVLGNPAKPR